MLDSLHELECCLGTEKGCHQLDSIYDKTDLGEVQFGDDGADNSLESVLWVL